MWFVTIGFVPILFVTFRWRCLTIGLQYDRAQAGRRDTIEHSTINDFEFVMQENRFQSLKGHFLMAMPTLTDPNFAKSVTCISEHTKEGAVGIVINRVHQGLNAKLIFDELEIPCDSKAEIIPIHIGGPVHVNELFILHGHPFHWGDVLPITDELAMSNSKAVLEAIGAGEGPSDFIIALGCAGWGAGQLEWEMKQNAWLTTPCDLDILFKSPETERWEHAIKRLGVDPDFLMDTPGTA